MAFTKSEYDFINLAVSIKGQADRLGIEHNGVPHEGVVASIAQRAVNAEQRIAELEAGIEWEYQWGLVHADFSGFDCFSSFEDAERNMSKETEYESDRVVRRRKAGPWQYAESEGE